MKSREELLAMKHEHLAAMTQSLQKTVVNQRDKIGELQRQRQQKDRVDGEYPDTPSMPLIILPEVMFGKYPWSDEVKPYCSKHGAMLRYEHNIYRCPTCGTGIDMTSLIIALGYKTHQEIIGEVDEAN